MDSKKYDQTILIGDIHGEFHVIKNAIHKYFFENTLFIQVGDFGLGFNHRRERIELKSLNKSLENGGNKLLVVRGNHDNPYFWEEGSEDFNKKYSHIKLIKDGSIEEIFGKKVLFLGGATSIDRLRRTFNINYWEGEALKVNFNTLEKCDIVISHTCPSYFNVGGDIKWYLDNDDTLKEDLEEERLIMDKVAKIVKPKDWYFGHFHKSTFGNHHEEGLNINWRCIGENEFKQISLSQS